MAHPSRVSIAAVLAAGLVTGLLVAAPATAVELPQDGIPGQSEVDGELIGQSGGWAALEGGVAARPFIKRLTVTRGGVETLVIDNSEGVANPTSLVSDLGVVIEPYNLCRPGQTPAQGVCYATPNRVSVNIGYVSNGQVHVDFDSPTDTANVDAGTVFDLQIGLNSLGKTLRWSWLTGLPSYWKIDNIGQDDAVLHVRFTPLQRAMTSNGGGCSQIPVNDTCEFAEAAGFFRTANLLLSLDTTLDAAFTGALFATDRAYIGSLDVAPGSSPVVTYGIAAPTSVTGQPAPNQARLWAFLSDATLLNSFQVPPGSGEPRGIFSLGVNAGGLGADPWDQWSADANGTDGWLVSSPRIAVPEAAASRTGRADSYSRAIKMTMKRKTAPAAITIAKSKSGGWTVAVSTSTSQKGTYRVVLSKVVSSTLGTTQGIATKAATRSSGKVSASLNVAASKLKKKQRVVALVQRKTGASWAYVTSGVKAA